jgi:spermidine/putrescine transport system permease protein
VIVFSFSAGSTTGVPIPGLTTSWYGDVVNRPGFAEGLRGSMFVALVAVALATAVAVPVAFALSRLDGVRQRLLWGAVALPFVVPPVLLGSSLLVAATDLDVPLGLGFTALAHSVLLISEIVVIVYARLQGIDAHLTEAARDLGASATKSLRTITFPILAPAMAGAALLAIAVSLDEVFVTSFTVGTDNTLPVWLLGEARQGFTPAVNAVGVMLLVGTLSGFGIATLLARRSVLGTSHD